MSTAQAVVQIRRFGVRVFLPAKDEMGMLDRRIVLFRMTCFPRGLPRAFCERAADAGGDGVGGSIGCADNGNGSGGHTRGELKRRGRAPDFTLPGFGGP